MNTKWMIRRNYIIIAALIVFLLGPALNFPKPQPHETTKQVEEKMNCKNCGKPLTGEYIEVDGFVFHPGCFVCAKCKKTINGSFQKLNSKYYHPTCYMEKMGLFCAKCGNPLADSWIEDKGKKYHSECFPLKCGICGKVLTGEYYYDNEGKYHKSCFSQHKAPTCNVCDQPIIAGKYITDVWGNRSHSEHNGDKILTCLYCSRIVSDSTSNGGYRLGDGRIICGICKFTSVDNDLKIKESVSKVIELLASTPVNIDDIPGDIPIRLVDIPALNELKGGISTDHGQGLTRSEVLYTNKKRTGVKHQIYILFGMPKLEFEAVLAHELLHVWLVNNNIELPAKDTEGFCNLGSALVYKADDSKFAQILLKRLEDNPDRLYGKGYRTMDEKLRDMGWEKLKRSISND